MELHHIEQRADDGEDTHDNCIPLCFDCHADVNSYNDKHPKGRKYSLSELKGHRDNWYQKVKKSHGMAINPDYIEVDRKLFSEIRAVLPSGGSIRFVRMHDYGAEFNRDVHDDLERFLGSRERPECEFLDADLEGMRARLQHSIEKFLGALALHTFHLPKTANMFRILLDPGRDRELAIQLSQEAKDEQEFNRLVEEQRERVFGIQRELNDLAQEVSHTYDDFIRFGRRKLAVY